MPRFYLRISKPESSRPVPLPQSAIDLPPSFEEMGSLGFRAVQRRDSVSESPRAAGS